MLGGHEHPSIAVAKEELQPVTVHMRPLHSTRCSWTGPPQLAPQHRVQAPLPSGHCLQLLFETLKLRGKWLTSQFTDFLLEPNGEAKGKATSEEAFPSLMQLSGLMAAAQERSRADPKPCCQPQT